MGKSAILITGASKGIGNAAALCLAAQNHTEFFNTNNPPGSESRERYVNSIPLGRVGEPMDVARPIAFLMSESASFITGQTIFVDGGASIGRAPF